MLSKHGVDVDHGEVNVSTTQSHAQVAVPMANTVEMGGPSTSYAPPPTGVPTPNPFIPGGANPCSNCGADVPAGNKFCEACGSPMMPKSPRNSDALARAKAANHPTGNPNNI